MPDPETPASVPAIPQDDQLSLPLQQTANLFQSDAGKEFSTPFLQELQQHLNATNVADANQAAGQQFASRFDDVKSNMNRMVTSDPTSVGFAMSAIPQLVRPLVDAAGLSDEHADAVHGAITDSMQQEVAHTAIMRMADFNADGAHGLMNALGDYVGGDDARNVLGTYINTMQAARSADTAAAANTGLSGQQRVSGINAYRYGGQLLDPRTEDVVFPPHYLEGLVKNSDISPADKAPLFDAYARLTQNGDVQTSNPYMVAKVVSDILDPNVPVSHGDILQHVGNDLKYADALYLHGMALQKTPEGTLAVRDVHNILQDAQQTLASSGDRAGNAAYSRFVNWFMPAYRRAGMDGLNPASENFLFNNVSLASFQPNHNDAVAPMPVTKRPLSEIFRAG